MRLVTLSVASMIGCILGLALLGATTWIGWERLNRIQHQITQMNQLSADIDEFSAASDSILLFKAGDQLWSAFKKRGEELRERTLRLGKGHPSAQKAAKQLEILSESVATARRSLNPLPNATGLENDPVPLGLPYRTRLIMNQVAGHGVALDTAIQKVLQDRRATLATRVNWAGALFAFSAILFGALCVAAFGLLYLQLSGPIRAFSRTIARLRQGESQVRVPIGSQSNEFTELAKSFNRLIDKEQEAQAKVRNQREALANQQELLEESQRIARVGNWRMDFTTSELEWSDEMARILGLDPERVQPTPELFFNAIHPEDLDSLLRQRDEGLERGESFDHTCRIVRADSEVRHVQLQARPQFGEGGELLGLSGTVQDITERIEAQRSKNRLAEVLETTSDFVGMADAAGQPFYVNPAGLQIVGDKPGKLRTTVFDYVPISEKGKLDKEILPQTRKDGKWEGELSLLHRDGGEVPTSGVVLGHFEATGALRFFSAICRDLTEQKAREAEIIRLSYRDPLTNLPNRRSFLERLNEEHRRAQRQEEYGGILFCDLDDFKAVNESLGHSVGDKLLQGVAQALQDELRTEDVLARLGVNGHFF